MNLFPPFNEQLALLNLKPSEDNLLLAVSGGIDSVVLCELCYQAGFDFVIAHCNFQLRGEESERDEAFVRSLGKKYGKQVLVMRFDTKKYAAEHKCSTQVAARELRYGWFNEIVNCEWSMVNGELSMTNSEKAVTSIHHSPFTIHHILTAHHADDNIETLLMNFFKGTGIAGLRGMLPKQGKIIRPLLSFYKKELLDFAREEHIEWMEDSSNDTDQYSRNYVRHQVIPLLQKIYPQVEENLADNLTRFRDIELLYQQAIEQHKKKLVEKRGNEVYIPALKLKKSLPLSSILFEIIREYGFTARQVNEVEGLLDSETGKYFQSDTHRIIKNRNWLIISPLAAGQATHVLIEQPGNWQLSPGRLLVKEFTRATDWKPPADSQIACLDLKHISFPLLIRPWKAGDYFYPLGMKKKKKLSRFLIDQKLSKTQKEGVWVVEMNRKIIWVMGHRIDERFKVTDRTKDILQLSFAETH